jgi:hypothetical protein
MKGSSNVWWRGSNDEETFGLDLSIGGQLGLKEALLLPPVVPCSLDSLGVVSGSHGL